MLQDIDVPEWQKNQMIVFDSAYLALLPLLARRSDSTAHKKLYGILLAAIGVGTVGGSLIIRWLKDELGPDRLVGRVYPLRSPSSYSGSRTTPSRRSQRARL